MEAGTGQAGRYREQENSHRGQPDHTPPHQENLQIQVFHTYAFLGHIAASHANPSYLISVELCN